MSATYTPSFLVSESVTDETYAEIEKIAKELSAELKREVTPEEVIKRAINFYSTQCVHTHSTKAKKIKSRVRRGVKVIR